MSPGKHVLPAASGWGFQNTGNCHEILAYWSGMYLVPTSIGRVSAQGLWGFEHGRISLAPVVDWSVGKAAKRCCRQGVLVCLPSQLRIRPRQTPWELLTAPNGFMESSANRVKSQTLGVRTTRTGEIILKPWWKMIVSKIFHLLQHGSMIGTQGIKNWFLYQFICPCTMRPLPCDSYSWGYDLSSTGMKPSPLRLRIQIKHHQVKWKFDDSTWFY